MYFENKSTPHNHNSHNYYYQGPSGFHWAMGQAHAVQGLPSMEV